MNYWDKEFTVEGAKDLLFKFREMSPIDILTISNDVEMFAGTYDNGLYKKYLTEVLENTLVKVNNTWLPVKEGNNYYPASLKTNLKALREITNNFFVEVIRPVFIDSSESTQEQK